MVLSLDKYPETDLYSKSLDTANLTFTFAFCAEMLIKLFGLGIVGYLRDSFNIFDGTIVMLSVLDLVLSNVGGGGGSGGGF